MCMCVCISLRLILSRETTGGHIICVANLIFHIRSQEKQLPLDRGHVYSEGMFCLPKQCTTFVVHELAGKEFLEKAPV